jgi:TonB-dependent SusC/RagA subfamily outer membrane receptor
MKIRIVIFISLFSLISFSQINSKIIIRGFVQDSTGRPINNAIIFADNRKTNKTTNAKGFFKIKLKNRPDKIKVLSSEYGTKEESYSGEKQMNIIFNNSDFNKNLVQGNIYYKKRRKIEKTPRVFNNIYDYLRARVAGVQISGDNKILIRGITSFNSSTDPLFIVNGSAISNIDDIDPNQIKSVTVLKGPETASYGVRGSNGVILIDY